MKRLIADQGLINAESFTCDLPTYLMDYPNASFDAVLCSHIFQHIAHETVDDILSRLDGHMPYSAMLICTTTFQNGSQNSYTKESWKNGKRVVTDLDSIGFYDAINNPDELPVCLFSVKWMKQALLEHHFRTVFFNVYHFVGNRTPVQDRTDNLCPDRLTLARDAIYIAVHQKQ